jgi:hypothetical protein
LLLVQHRVHVYANTALHFLYCATMTMATTSEEDIPPVSIIDRSLKKKDYSRALDVTTLLKSVEDLDDGSLRLSAAGMIQMGEVSERLRGLLNESAAGRQYQATDLVAASRKAVETLFRHPYADQGGLQRSHSLKVLSLQVADGGLDRKREDAMTKAVGTKKSQDPLGTSLHAGKPLTASGMIRNRQFTTESSSRSTKTKGLLEGIESNSHGSSHAKKETNQRSRRTVPHKVQITDGGIRRKESEGHRGRHCKRAHRQARSLSPAKIKDMDSDTSINSDVSHGKRETKPSSRHKAPHKTHNGDGRLHQEDVKGGRGCHSKVSLRRASSLSPVNLRQALDADSAMTTKCVSGALSRKHKSQDHNKSPRKRGHKQHHVDNEEEDISKRRSDPFVLSSKSPRARSPRRATVQERAHHIGVEDDEVDRKRISSASLSNGTSHRPTGGANRGRIHHGMASDQLDRIMKKHTGGEEGDQEPPKSKRGSTQRRQRLNPTKGQEIQAEEPCKRISGQISAGATCRRNVLRDTRRSVSFSPMRRIPSADGPRGILRHHSSRRLLVEDDDDDDDEEESPKGSYNEPSSRASGGSIAASKAQRREPIVTKYLGWTIDCEQPQGTPQETVHGQGRHRRYPCSRTCNGRIGISSKSQRTHWYGRLFKPKNYI